jgi:hypothetical protein
VLSSIVEQLYETTANRRPRIYKSHSFCTIYIIREYMCACVFVCEACRKVCVAEKKTTEKRDVVHFLGGRTGDESGKKTATTLAGSGNVSRFAGFSPRKATHYLRVRQAATDDERQMPAGNGVTLTTSI